MPQEVNEVFTPLLKYISRVHEQQSKLRRTKNPLRKATAEDVEALEAGTSRCRKLLDRLRGLMEEVPTPTLKSNIKTGSLKPKNPPSGWLPEKVAAHEKKVRETLVEIAVAIRPLILLENSKTTQRPQKAAMEAVRAGGRARAAVKEPRGCAASRLTRR